MTIAIRGERETMTCKSFGSATNVGAKNEIIQALMKADRVIAVENLSKPGKVIANRKAAQ